MRRERVAEAVRVGDEPAERARVEPPAPGGEEERILGAAGELRTSLADVAAQPVGRLFPERHGSLLAALAADVEQLLLEVDVAEVEVDRLAAPQPRRVDELDQGTVATASRALAVERFEDAVDLVGLRRVGKPAAGDVARRSRRGPGRLRA